MAQKFDYREAEDLDESQQYSNAKALFDGLETLWNELGDDRAKQLFKHLDRSVFHIKRIINDTDILDGFFIDDSM